MRLKAKSKLLKDCEVEATINTEHSASPYGLPVLVIEGKPVGKFEARFAGYEVIEATQEERELLAKGGYTHENT